MAELPRQSCRMQGKPLEYTPSQLEKLKYEKGQPSGTGSIEQEETSVIIHPDYEVDQPQTTESSQRKISIFELVELASTTSELSATKPEISKPEIEPATFEPASEFITPTPSLPHSPRVKFRITENLPPGLISIKEITDKEEEIILPSH